jgi:hypothetical protein
VALKDMRAGTQEIVARDKVVGIIKNVILSESPPEAGPPLAEKDLI